MRKIFIDTGAWIALILKGDLWHSEAEKFIKQALKEGSKFFTSNYVLDETLTRLLYDQDLREAKEFYKRIRKSVFRNELAIFWIDETIADDAWEAFVKFAEHKLSFTDATSYALMKRYRLDEVFAFDEDFARVGLNVKP